MNHLARVKYLNQKVLGQEGGGWTYVIICRGIAICYRYKRLSKLSYHGSLSTRSDNFSYTISCNTELLGIRTAPKSLCGRETSAPNTTSAWTRRCTSSGAPRACCSTSAGRSASRRRMSSTVIYPQVCMTS